MDGCAFFLNFWFRREHIHLSPDPPFLPPHLSFDDAIGRDANFSPALDCLPTHLPAKKI